MEQSGEIKRICCGCRETKNRLNLIKITVDHMTKEVCVNPNSKTFGRSVYLCPKQECLEKAVKKNSILKMLKIPRNSSSKDLMEKIRAVLENIIVLNIY